MVVGGVLAIGGVGGVGPDEETGTAGTDDVEERAPCVDAGGDASAGGVRGRRTNALVLVPTVPTDPTVPTEYWSCVLLLFFLFFFFFFFFAVGSVTSIQLLGMPS